MQRCRKKRVRLNDEEGKMYTWTGLLDALNNPSFVVISLHIPAATFDRPGRVASKSANSLVALLLVSKIDDNLGEKRR